MFDKQKTDLLAADIRNNIVRSVASAGSGHVGGSLSMADLMAVLYENIMNYDANNPTWDDRDYLIISKGHCAVAQYAALALKGFFPEEELLTLNDNGTRLPSHTNKMVPGVDASTGSLGQGASIAAGVALAAKRTNKDSYTYLVLGDGECNEGQVWEMAMFAAHYELDNLIAFIDLNKQQLDGDTDEVLRLGSLADKFTSFDWAVQEVDGHDTEAIYEAIKEAKVNKTKPSMIILDTIKGKGWSKLEGKPNVHHCPVTADDLSAYELECLKKSEEV